MDEISYAIGTSCPGCNTGIEFTSNQVLNHEVVICKICERRIDLADYEEALKLRLEELKKSNEMVFGLAGRKLYFP